MKMPIWDYNDKLYLKVNDLRIRELPGDRVFQKGVPYIMVYFFRNMTLRRKVSRLLVIVFLKLIKVFNLLYIYIQNGITRIKFTYSNEFM